MSAGCLTDDKGSGEDSTEGEYERKDSPRTAEGHVLNQIRERGKKRSRQYVSNYGLMTRRTCP